MNKINEENYVEVCCENCEFCMPGDNELVCAGHSAIKDIYGTPIKKAKKIYPNGCDDFNYSFEAFIKNEKIKESRRKK